MLCRTVVFDLFGTLVPFPSAKHKRSLAEMSAILSVPVKESWELWARAYTEQELGETIEESIRRVCREADVNPVANQLEQAARIWWAFQRQLLSRPRRDAVATLINLRSAGCTIAMVTNCPAEVPALWSGSTLAMYVDVPVFSSVCGIKKPDPRIYGLACEQLSVEPSQCVFVGDGGSDELAGAESVGMRAVQLRASDLHVPDSSVSHWKGETVLHLSDLIGQLGVTRNNMSDR